MNASPSRFMLAFVLVTSDILTLRGVECQLRVDTILVKSYSSCGETDKVFPGLSLLPQSKLIKGFN